MTFRELMDIIKRKHEIQRRVREAKAERLREALRKIGEKQAGGK